MGTHCYIRKSSSDHDDPIVGEIVRPANHSPLHGSRRQARVCRTIRGRASTRYMLLDCFLPTRGARGRGAKIVLWYGSRRRATEASHERRGGTVTALTNIGLGYKQTQMCRECSSWEQGWISEVAWRVSAILRVLHAVCSTTARRGGPSDIWGCKSDPLRRSCARIVALEH